MEPLYDTHAHLFVLEDRYPVDLRGAREGEEALRQRLTTDPLPADKLLRWWDESGVIGGAGVQYNTVFKTDNRFLLDTSDANPERISSVVILDATAPDSPAKLEQMATERGIVGLRLYGQPDADGAYPWFDSRAAHDSWEVVNRHKLSMVLMYAPAAVSAAALWRIAALANRFPDTQIALDHFGWPRGPTAQAALAPALVEIAKYPNVHFKITSINFGFFEEDGLDAADFVRHAADTIGIGKMMWGSDVGNTLETYPQMAARARASAALLNAEERRAFLCENGRKLFERKHRPA